MNFNPGRVYHEMCGIFDEYYNPDNKVLICNEGSSRSKKSFDAFHFIYTFCDHNKGEGNMIYILRNTLKDCREKTFDDFKKCMKIIGYQANYFSKKVAPELVMFGNDIRFRGLDHESTEGYPSDIVFYNESLEMDKERISGIQMRCRKLEIYDWNPKYSQHWCFNLEYQENAFFTHSTYKDNIHLQKSVIASIEKYCPWHFDDLHIEDEKKRRPHPTNIKNQTANKHKWLVYGEGIRSAPEGLIFQYANYIYEWPKHIAYVYGLDFGFTNDPTCLVRVGQDSTDIYLELLCYTPISTSAIIDSFMTSIRIERYLPIIADSSDKFTAENKGTVEMVKELRVLGWKITKVSKTISVIFWLEKMQDKRINIVINHLVEHARRCQENYMYKLVNGIKLNQPDGEKRIQGFKTNDFWDGARYGFMALNQSSEIRATKR